MAKFSALTKKQMDVVEECFNFFDFMKKDKVSTADLKTMVRSLGQNPTERDIDDMINEIDPSRDGFFSRDQFVHLMSKGRLKNFTTWDDEMQETFHFFDKSGDGFISVTELRHALMKLGDTRAADELDEVLHSIDVDHDGRISYEEFVTWFTGGRVKLV